MDRLLKFLIASIYLPCDAVRRALLRLAGSQQTPPFTVLMYHAVKPHQRARFARQMDLLTRIAHAAAADLPAGAVATRTVAVTFDDALQSVLENAVPILQARNIPFAVFVPTKSLGERPGWIVNDGHPNASERLLSADELKRLHQLGALIGSHGVTHRPLTELSDAEALAELSESRAELEQIVQAPVGLFALPYGAGDDRVFALAKRAGYEQVFLSVPVGSGTAFDEFVRGRVEASPSDWALEYRLKIVGAYRWLPAAIAAKRGVMRFVLHRRVEAA